MAVTRWEPATDIMRPFLDNFFSGMERFGANGLRMPETDVVESQNDIRVHMEVPGLRAEDVNVELEGNVLTISGEKRENWEEPEGEGPSDSRYHLSERRWGQFTRSFVLPREVQSEKIEASYRDGLLTVTIPKGIFATPIFSINARSLSISSSVSWAKYGMPRPPPKSRVRSGRPTRVAMRRAISTPRRYCRPSTLWSRIWVPVNKCSPRNSIAGSAPKDRKNGSDKGGIGTWNGLPAPADVSVDVECSLQKGLGLSHITMASTRHDIIPIIESQGADCVPIKR